MPWPEFSELSFGFSFLREFERLYTNGGHFPSAPDFITAAVEAKKGYDVGVVQNGIPVFFQFKRSYVLTTKRAKEIKSGHFSRPKLYRMSLQRKDKFRQHKALQLLEQSHPDVFYVTSQVSTFKELSQAYLNDEVIEEATALFTPSEIVLPNDHEEHYVSFKPGWGFAWLFSEEGQKFKRKHSYSRETFDARTQIRDGKVDTEEMLFSLELKLKDIVKKLGLPVYAEVDGETAAERVSQLAFWGFDMHLKFHNPTYQSK